MSDDNTLTDEYIDHWVQLAAPLVAATDLELYAFDPGITLSNGQQTVNLPVWFLERVNQRLPNPFEKPKFDGIPPICNCGNNRSAIIPVDGQLMCILCATR